MHTLPNLSPSTTREAFATLCAGLPAPLADTPEDRAIRDEAAMAAVAALHPTDAFEARLAARIVATDAHAMDCLRRAAAASEDAAEVRRCLSKAGLMMRHLDNALRVLERRQAARQKLEAAKPKAMDARDEGERPDDEAQNVPLAEPAPVPAAPPDPAAQPRAGRDERPFSALTAAEDYAVRYPDHAARIRAHGGLPADPDMPLVDSRIVAMLVNGTSPILLALDRPARTAAAA